MTRSILFDSTILFSGIVILYLLSAYNYLIFHTIAELFGIIIMFSMFLITWNAKKYMRDKFLLFIGIAFVFVGILDLLHTLSYQGMQIFEGFGANLPTQMWIASRAMQAASLLIGAWLMRKEIVPSKVFVVYSILTVTIIAAIFTGLFPVAYDNGLTTFKIASEYAIIVSFIIAGYLLYRAKQKFELSVYRLLMSAIILAILSELAFTLYTDVYGYFNFAGHILKIIEFYLIYLAVIYTGLNRPYDLLFRELIESNNLKDTFIDIMRHDLSNPAGTVKTYALLLLRDETREDKRKIITSMIEQSNRVSRMIDDASLFAQLNSDEELVLTTQNLSIMLEQAIADVQPLAKSKNIRIKPFIDKVVVPANPLIQNVFSNLIQNAIKYSPENTRIRIRLKRGQRIRFEVEDQGEGIEPEAREAIFERFKRLEKGPVKGTGLGLAIVKKIIEMHHGKVWVEPARPRGSIFIAEIPQKILVLNKRNVSNLHSRNI